MKTRTHSQSGLSLVEILVIVATVVLLFLAFAPRLTSRGNRAPRISCTSHLKQVGLAYRLWSNDHNDRFPFASTNAESSLPFVNSPAVFRHFQVMSNELVTPKILVCLSDGKRTKATDFDKFSNANLSYFVGFDAREDSPQSILSGDRNVTGGTLSNGFLRVLGPKTEAGWTKEIHVNAGNIGLGDGSVQQVTVKSLQTQVQNHLEAMTNLATIRLAIP
jgi:competence protein ComGC